MFSFVLTEGSGARVYCSCLSFWDEYKDQPNGVNLMIGYDWI